jgi:hypothetical protein
MEARLYKNWSEDEKDVFRKWLISHLKYGPVTVYFTKKDGTERKMKCTLKEDIIPQKVTSESIVQVKVNRTFSDDALPVYDIEANGWRSFRWDSVTSIEWSLGEDE